MKGHPPGVIVPISVAVDRYAEYVDDLASRLRSCVSAAFMASRTHIECIKSGRRKSFAAAVFRSHCVLSADDLLVIGILAKPVTGRLTRMARHQGDRELTCPVSVGAIRELTLVIQGELKPVCKDDVARLAIAEIILRAYSVKLSSSIAMTGLSWPIFAASATKPPAGLMMLAAAASSYRALLAAHKLSGAESNSWAKFETLKNRGFGIPVDRIDEARAMHKRMAQSHPFYQNTISDQIAEKADAMSNPTANPTAPNANTETEADNRGLIDRFRDMWASAFGPSQEEVTEAIEALERINFGSNCESEWLAARILVALDGDPVIVKLVKPLLELIERLKEAPRFLSGDDECEEELCKILAPIAAKAEKFANKKAAKAEKESVMDAKTAEAIVAEIQEPRLVMSTRLRNFVEDCSRSVCESLHIQYKEEERELPDYIEVDDDGNQTDTRPWWKQVVAGVWSVITGTAEYVWNAARHAANVFKAMVGINEHGNALYEAACHGGALGLGIPLAAFFVLNLLYAGPVIALAFAGIQALMASAVWSLLFGWFMNILERHGKDGDVSFDDTIC